MTTTFSFTLRSKNPSQLKVREKLLRYGVTPVFVPRRGQCLLRRLD